MESLNYVYYLITTGFLVLVGFVSYAAYRMSRVLSRFEEILDDVADTTNDIQQIKNSMKIGVYGLVLRLLGKPGEGGGEQ